MAVLALVMVALLGLLLSCHFLFRRQQAAYHGLPLQDSAISQAYDAQGSAQSAEPPGVSVMTPSNLENE